MLGITPLNGSPRRLRELGIEFCNLFGASNSIFNNEVKHAEEMLTHFRSVIQINFSWMYCVIPNHATKVESLLNLYRKPFSYQ